MQRDGSRFFIRFLSHLAFHSKTRAMRAGMRLSIAVEHPGDLTAYRNGEFFRILRISAEKKEKLVVPCAFSGISLRCCLPLGS